jgi:hypothetical protein
MKNTRILFLIALVAALVLVSGCVKINFRENISPNGISDFTMIIEPVNKSAVEENVTDPCNEINLTDTKMSNVRCNYDRFNKVLTLSGTVDRRDTPGFTMSGTRYRVDVSKIMQSEDQNGSSVTMPRNETEIAELKKSGFVYDYYVKMPGTIVGQSGGTVQLDGSVKFDLVDLPENAYVESDTGLGALLGGGGIREEQPSEEGTGEEGANQQEGSSPLSSCCCCAPILPLLGGLLAGLSKALPSLRI